MGHEIDEALGQELGCRPLPRPDLVCNLPRDYAADVHFWLSFNCGSSPSRESRIVNRPQNKVWLSRRIAIQSLPKHQLLFREGVEKEGVGYAELTRQNSGFPLERLLRHWRQPHDWLLAARGHDLLAGFGARDELGKVRLGGVDCDSGHVRSRALADLFR